MSRETILVTGATGFIGSHVVEALLSQGVYSILAITRENGNERKIDALKRKGVTVVEGEFYDPMVLEKAFGGQPIHHVIHLAALRGAGGGRWSYYYSVNVRGTEVLLEASLNHGVKKFIHCSTVGVHGTVPMDCPATVNSPFNGDNHYHASKIQAETKVCDFLQKGLNAYILRPTITYGPGHNGFPTLLASLVRRRMLLLPKDDIKIHLLNVLAFCDLVINMLGGDSWTQKVFIVADEEPVLLKKLADSIYFHYHKTHYPSFLRLPNQCTEYLLKAFQLTRSEKWLTRILLISNHWHYDISETVDLLKYIPSRTENSFVRSLCA